MYASCECSRLSIDPRVEIDVYPPTGYWSSSSTRVGTSLRPTSGRDRARRQAGLEPGRRLEDLPVGDVLAHVGQGGPLFQRDHVLRAEHLGQPAGGADQCLVLPDEQRQRAVAVRLVVPLGRGAPRPGSRRAARG